MIDRCERQLKWVEIDDSTLINLIQRRSFLSLSRINVFNSTFSERMSHREKRKESKIYKSHPSSKNESNLYYSSENQEFQCKSHKIPEKCPNRKSSKTPIALENNTNSDDSGFRKYSCHYNKDETYHHCHKVGNKNFKHDCDYNCQGKLNCQNHKKSSRREIEEYLKKNEELHLIRGISSSQSHIMDTTVDVSMNNLEGSREKNKEKDELETEVKREFIDSLDRRDEKNCEIRNFQQKTEDFKIEASTDTREIINEKKKKKLPVSNVNLFLKINSFDKFQSDEIEDRREKTRIEKMPKSHRNQLNFDSINLKEEIDNQKIRNFIENSKLSSSNDNIKSQSTENQVKREITEIQTSNESKKKIRAENIQYKRHKRRISPFLIDLLRRIMLSSGEGNENSRNIQVGILNDNSCLKIKTSKLESSCKSSDYESHKNIQNSYKVDGIAISEEESKNIETVLLPDTSLSSLSKSSGLKFIKSLDYIEFLDPGKYSVYRVYKSSYGGIVLKELHNQELEKGEYVIGKRLSFPDKLSAVKNSKEDLFQYHNSTQTDLELTSQIIENDKSDFKIDYRKNVLKKDSSFNLTSDSSSSLELESSDSEEGYSSGKVIRKSHSEYSKKLISDLPKPPPHFIKARSSMAVKTTDTSSCLNPDYVEKNLLDYRKSKNGSCLKRDKEKIRNWELKREKKSSGGGFFGIFKKI